MAETKVIIDAPTLSVGMTMGFMVDYFLETDNWWFLLTALGLMIMLIAVNVWENTRSSPPKP